MVIVIRTNGDRRWRQWRWGAPSAPLGPLPMAQLDRQASALLNFGRFRGVMKIRVLLPWPVTLAVLRLLCQTWPEFFC